VDSGEETDTSSSGSDGGDFDDSFFNDHPEGPTDAAPTAGLVLGDDAEEDGLTPELRAQLDTEVRQFEAMLRGPVGPGSGPGLAGAIPRRPLPHFAAVNVVARKVG